MYVNQADNLNQKSSPKLTTNFSPNISESWIFQTNFCFLWMFFKSAFRFTCNISVMCLLKSLNQQQMIFCNNFMVKLTPLLPKGSNVHQSSLSSIFESSVHKMT